MLVCVLTALGVSAVITPLTRFTVFGILSIVHSVTTHLSVSVCVHNNGCHSVAAV